VLVTWPVELLPELAPDSEEEVTTKLLKPTDAPVVTVVLDQVVPESGPERVVDASQVHMVQG
jgi:hypothetical protein